MSVPNQDVEVTEGAPFGLYVQLKNPDGTPYALPPGTVVDWWASPSQFDAPASVPLKKSTNAGTIEVAAVGAGSAVLVHLSNVDTIGRGQQRLFHQARSTQPDGATHPLFSGTMTVVKRLVV